MRPTRSRVILGGAIGVIAAAAFALTPPGSGAGRVARRTTDQPIESFTIQGAGGAVYQTKTEFNPKVEYRFVISGTTRIPGQPNGCGYPPMNCPDELGDAFYDYSAGHSPAPGGAGLTISADVGATNPFRVGQPTYPAYSDTHTYEITVSGLSGHLYFTPSRGSNLVGRLSGSFSVEIFAGTEKVDFAVTQSGHHVLPNKHGAFVVTTTKGLGQLVVPTPKSGESFVASTSATGAISFSEFKFSAKDVLLLTEDKLSLKVTGADFYPEQPGRAPHVLLGVSVSKSANTEACPTGSEGVVTLFDGATIQMPDKLRIAIRSCGLDIAYKAGQLGAKVAVAIKVE